MNDLTQVLKAGTLLVIETGEYSDRCWSGPVRVLRDFQKSEAAEAFRASFVPDPDPEACPEGVSPYDFLPWLVTNGYVGDAGIASTWHVGSYGEFYP